jgi:aspartyl-tRNA(Asn)/glutamyl-tRNA(Gln) amidotransferase subunit B
MNLYPIIGLEVHAQLNTTTKLFCRCLNQYCPDKPNKNICPFCTGQPGALPVLNKSAVQKAIQFGVAVHANIPPETRWDRKNYFYPDLPAGYQISQYDNPIVEGGIVEFYVQDDDQSTPRKHSVQLTRAHLEADAGKSLHVGNKTLVDFNRSGSPLIEIVSDPVIRSAAEAMAYVGELQLLVRTLGISDGDMDKGQMRFDCNLSLQTEDEHREGKLPSYKVEIKNINSIRAVGRAIEYEIKRQTEMLENGQTPAQETRGWKDDLNKSVAQRSKEEAHDYRYFPEPDLQILQIRESDIPNINDLPSLPNVKREEYLDAGLNFQTAHLFVSQIEVGEFYNQAIQEVKDDQLKKNIANIIATNLQSTATKSDKSINDILIPEQIKEIASLYSEDKISNQAIQTIIDELAINPEQTVEQITITQGLIQVSDDSSLIPIVQQIINENPNPVSEYREGKVQVIGFLVGQCMKASKGSGNPKKFKQLLENELNS